ncbi:MAG: hypothetical protein JSS01_10635 [Proteobacteria bacterium]|nr:hypothetical protein [Pseudomonadota bacterium]
MKISACVVRTLVEAAVLALLVGCASTSVTVQPSPQTPVCDHSAVALVLWAPHWRPDQKDVAAREQAANTGFTDFLAQSDCFARAELRRVPELTPPAIRAQLAEKPGEFTKVLAIEVRELGPVVKLLSSAALVEGGTEVVFEIAEFSVPSVAEQRRFTVRWLNGGPGVVKGVAGLPGDMQAALRAGLQPGASAR